MELGDAIHSIHGTIRVNTTESRLEPCLNRLLQQNLQNAELAERVKALSHVQANHRRD
jgi:hypothetical protein